MVEVHLTEMQKLAETPLTAEQAVKHLEAGTDGLSFAFYQLKGMIKDLEQQYIDAA